MLIATIFENFNPFEQFEQKLEGKNLINLVKLIQNGFFRGRSLVLKTSQNVRRRTSYT